MSRTPGAPQETPDELLAQSALKRGFVTPPQLKEALAEQAPEVTSGRQRPRPLMNILLSKGFVSQDQLVILREEHGAGSRGREQKYTVQEEIARGGMGKILRVEDREIRRPAAMKVMLDGSDEKSRV